MSVEQGLALTIMAIIAFFAGAVLTEPEMVKKRTTRYILWLVILLFGLPPVLLVWLKGVLG